MGKTFKHSKRQFRDDYEYGFAPEPLDKKKIKTEREQRLKRVMEKEQLSGDDESHDESFHYR